jgi:hypothetical protein
MNTLPKISLFLSCLFFFLSIHLSAQDTYHSNLQSELQSTYGLPEGSWIFNDTETANLGIDYSYGNVNLSDADVSGQDFSKKVTLDVTMGAGAQFATGYGMNSAQPVENGARCLLVVWLRSVDGDGKSLFFGSGCQYICE